MELSIELDDSGVDRLFARAPHELTRAIELATDDAQNLLLREMRLYPPKTRSRTYVRTETLKRSWHKRPIRRDGFQIIGEVVSSGMTAPYNVFVQQASMQAVQHRGRWPTEAAVAERTRPYVVGFYRIRIQRAVAALGR